MLARKNVLRIRKYVETVEESDEYHAGLRWLEANPEPPMLDKEAWSAWFNLQQESARSCGERAEWFVWGATPCPF